MKHREEMKQIIINEVCSFYGLNPDQLKSKSREGIIPEARAVTASILFNNYTDNKCEISRTLGQSKKWYSYTIKRKKESKVINNIDYCTSKVLQTLQTIENTSYTKLENLVCNEYGISQSDLKSSKCGGEIKPARITYAYLLFKHFTDNKNTIAKILHRRSHSSVIDYLNNAEGLIQIRDTKFINHLKSIENGIN